MPAGRKSFAEGSVYRTMSMYPHGWCEKIADSATYFVNAQAVDTVAVPNSALPKLLTLVTRFNPGPTTLAITLNDTDNTLTIGLEFDFFDAYGERKVERQIFGPPSGGVAGVRQTNFAVAILNSIKIFSLTGNGAADTLSIGIIGAAGAGNTGLGIAIPRHLKNTNEFLVRKGVTSQANDTQFKAPDFYQGLYFPAQAATEGAFFVIATPQG